MKRVLLLVSVFFSCAHGIYLTNSSITKKSTNNPALWTEDGVWSPILEDWVISKSRTAKVMQLPFNGQSLLINERMDTHIDDRESKINTGKIVNNSSNKKPPPKQVSETDLYLLGAIEKLVYRTEFLEKRLRRVEEMLYYVMAGNRVDEEPCPGNFTRVGGQCYLFSSAAGREYDWKVASKYCKKNGASLVELETTTEYQDVIAYIQTNSHLRGKDFWTGGLNPGLLWIWSNSARPLAGQDQQNKKDSINIHGDGRCLRLSYDPALRSYRYMGSDCSIRHSYICEINESTASNQLRRIGRSKKILDD